MPDFTLTGEQRNIRELAHDFAEKEIRPVAWDYDRDATWPREIIDKAWELGLMNPQLPERYGGTGASYFDGVLIGEELAWGCAAIATTIGINELAATPVLLGGSERIRARYLGMLSEQPRLASFCLTEAEAGSDVSAMRTTAVRKRDKYVINGSKVFISNGGYADWYTVYAKTDKDAGHRGISAFLVPRDATVTVDKHEDKMGLRASNTAAISFNETEVPAEHLLGDENHGFKLAMMTLDRSRPGVAAMATGIARAAFEFATDYSKQRIQFGAPIAMHQAIQFMIADMATKIEAARLLGVHKSAVLLDQGQRNTLGSTWRTEAGSQPLGDEKNHRRGAGLRRVRLHQGLPGREADARREDHAALRGHVADPAAGDRPGDTVAPPDRAVGSREPAGGRGMSATDPIRATRRRVPAAHCSSATTDPRMPSTPSRARAACWPPGLRWS